MQILQLRGEDIDGDEFSCTGPQLAKVLDELTEMPELTACAWFAAAVDAIEPGQLEPFGADQWTEILNIKTVIEQVRATRQFLDGVFVAIENSDWPEKTAEAITAYTPMTRSAANSKIELRAYDTTFVEIYSDHPELIERLRPHFGGELTGSPSPNVEL
jgi:hypothetical protein